LIKRIILRRAVGVLRHRGRLAVEGGLGGALGDRKHPFTWTKTADDILDGITVKGFQRRTTSEASPLTAALTTNCRSESACTQRKEG
jgi:hypothetical protein